MSKEIVYELINYLKMIVYRAVAPDDKSVSIALSEMLCSVLAYIPGPIVYGYLVGKYRTLLCVIKIK